MCQKRFARVKKHHSPDMSKHAFFGTDAAIPDKYRERKTEI
jgi:betaine-homocysteine S-methyltransferase